MSKKKEVSLRAHGRNLRITIETHQALKLLAGLKDVELYEAAHDAITAALEKVLQEKQSSP